jgi:uncharacterized protein YjbI with pentapeptide repeats
MSEQDGKQATTIHRPPTNNPEAWKAYWEKQGQPWRTEPEIDTERQKYLDERRAIVPDIKQGVYPFKDVKLDRADVEWLLATHENGRGPVNWNDEKQRERKGLDLRGADLRSINLSRLPLARIYGGGSYWSYGTAMQHEAGLAHFEGASFVATHLEGAFLIHTHLENADLSAAHLESANLSRAHLNGTWFSKAHLEKAVLEKAHLEGANLDSAHLEGTNLSNTFFDNATNLTSVALGNSQLGVASLADIHWGDINLAVVRWAQVNILGEEYKAGQKNHKGETKNRSTRLQAYEDAVRANRQLAVVLQAQGLNEDASRFAYRAQKLQRVVFRRQRKFVQYLFSLFLDILAGYGYKPWRSFLAYLIVIIAFATAYFIIGRTVGPTLSPVSAWVFSMTSFHGRGFFPGGIELDDPLTILAALEAFVGLLIEVTFIATLTQRLFGK